MKLNEYYNIALGSDSLIEEYKDDESFPVMVAGFGGDGDHYIYYIGYDNDKAMSTFDELKDDWVELGLGGGDTELAALEYTGGIAKFEEAIKAFEADPSNTIFDDFFTDDDVEVLDSVLDDPRKKLFSLFEQRRTKMKLIKRHLEEAKADLTKGKGYKYFINGEEITADEYENYLFDDVIDSGQPESVARRVAKENREDACKSKNGSNTWIILDGSELTILCESLNDGMFDQTFYNTQEIINNTTGKNKSFISRVAKHQEEKYGNVDIFDASLKYGEVRLGFGDYSLTFFFDDEGNIKDITGNGQGKYQSSLEAVAKELYKKFGIENGFLGED